MNKLLLLSYLIIIYLFNTACSEEQATDDMQAGDEQSQVTESDDNSKNPVDMNQVDMSCYQECLAKGETDDLCLSVCADFKDEADKNIAEAIDLLVDNETRQYRIFTPSTMQTSMPVIVFFHGGGGRNSEFPQQSKFEALAENQGIILIFAMGEARDGEEGDWLLNTTANRQQDIRYLETLLESVTNTYSVDQSRIYAVGYSLGSMYTYEVACHLSHRFTAIASYAGSMPINPSSCEQSRALSIMHIHGVDDPIISYDESWDWKAWDIVGSMFDIPGLIQYWSTKYDCQSQDEVTFNEGIHISHTDCIGDTSIEHYRLTNSGHEWPQQINQVSTHQVIWEFLSTFSQ